MSVYELYKPLRNYLRQVCRLEALRAFHAYLQNLQFDVAIPSDIDVHVSYRYAKNRPSKGIHEWELELLTKEVILNSPDYATCPKSFTRWPDFATAVKLLRELENNIVSGYPDQFKPNTFLEIYRIAHRQFPWQRRPNSSDLLRYFKIFGEPTLDAILQERIGLGAKQLYTLGLAFVGHYINRFDADYPLSVEIPGIDAALGERFAAHFSADIPTLRSDIAATQSYDQDFAYTFNPLRKFPLVRMAVGGRTSLIAPIPTYLFRRFTEGVYYEIYDHPRFGEGFGASFSNYVGEVLSKINEDDRLVVFREQEYYVGKDRKDTVDWLVADDTAALFVECKTKKVRYDSKIALADTAPLDDDLEKMASFVVQAYKTLLDCERGYYPKWNLEKHRVYPVIVTLEDWYAFGHKIIAQELDKKINEKLVQSGIDSRVMDTSPYTICSVADFEAAMQIMKRRGIGDFMVYKNGNRLTEPLPAGMG